jgi:hypothetical protein
MEGGESAAAIEFSSAIKIDLMGHTRTLPVSTLPHKHTLCANGRCGTGVPVSVIVGLTPLTTLVQSLKWPPRRLRWTVISPKRTTGFRQSLARCTTPSKIMVTLACSINHAHAIDTTRHRHKGPQSRLGHTRSYSIHFHEHILLSPPH